MAIHGHLIMGLQTAQGYNLVPDAIGSASRGFALGNQMADRRHLEQQRARQEEQQILFFMKTIEV